MSDAERPLADEETERRVKETFPVDVPPEEFAARDGYGWLDFPFARYRYRDSELDAWIQATKEILQNPARLRECRARYLTPAERQLMARWMADDNESVDD
jgi:hypothetical protein